MEVIVGPTFSIEVSVPDDFVIDRNVSAPPPGKASWESPRRKVSAAAASPCILSKNEKGDCPDGRVDEIGSGQMTEYSSDSSSSIGTPGESEDEAESVEDDVVSSEVDRFRVEGLGSLSSLEDSLPVNRRGLSSHYKGKSKSFGNLAEISTVKQVEKQENPLNKRRRLQICSKWSRKSFYSWRNPKSMPLLPVNEDEEDDDGEEEDEKDDGKSGFDETKSSLSSSSDDDVNVKGMRRRQQLKLQGRKMKSFKAKNFKSRSCFALSDLHEEEDE